MRFMLPFLSACILVPVNSALAADNSAATTVPAAPPANGRKVDASYFLEEITPQAPPAAKAPAKPASKNAKGAKPQPAGKPAAAAAGAPAKSGLLNNLEKQAPSSHFQQGLVMQSMGLNAHAITEYYDALKEDPKFISTYNNLAQCLVNRNDEGDLQEALKLLNQAAKIEPNNVGTRHALAVLKERNKDNNGAIDEYKKILEMQPLNMRAIANLSELYYRIGDKEKAREVIQTAIKLKPPEQQLSIFKEALVNLDKPKPAQTEPKQASREASPTK